MPPEDLSFAAAVERVPRLRRLRLLRPASMEMQSASANLAKYKVDQT